MTVYIFDGSFEGFLTALFEFYERKPGRIQLVLQSHFQPGLLEEPFEVITDPVKSTRVWKGLQAKLSPDWQKRFYTAFLSEVPDFFQHLFEAACYIFDHAKGAEHNYGNPALLAVAQMDRSVHREKHRMEAFIRFQETADGIFYAPIEPDYNVLPLISRFFKNRYADQQWIIYDLKRRYGLFYDLQTVAEVSFEMIPEAKTAGTYLPEQLLDSKEHLYALLWNDYFKSTNIPARKNMKLHIQHVPKRYWKYLTEKKGKN